MEEPKKMDLRSIDMTAEHKAKLMQIFPHVFNEDKIDFERLKQTLGEDIDSGLERFGLTWPGKSECMKIIQQPSIGTLKPCKEESVNFDTTENIFIEGDNLEVLKLLQKSYYGKVKMIYIDPPYNTGKEFIYPDKYSETLETYLAYTGQVDSEGKKFSTNTEADGRFHSKWLNMMFPRIFFARNLLKEDGVIFISIDDHEVDNLRKLCSEVFGEENFIAQICHKARASVSNDKIISSNHNHVLLYAKNAQEIHEKRHLFGLDPELEGFDKKDDVDFYKLVPVDGPGGAAKGNPYYEFLGIKQYFRFSLETMKRKYDEGRIVKVGNGIQQKLYLSEAKNTRKTDTTWWDEKLYTSTATARLSELMGGDYFDNPKPVELIQRMLRLWSRDQTDIILDFFAGSGTTAQAVIELNKSDGINRNFILIQLPELCTQDTEAFKAGYKTIASITKERIRRVIKKIQEESKSQLDFKNSKIDLGFKVFKLDQSNFKIWDGVIDQATDGKRIEKQLELQIEHINPKATEDEILYELLLKSGFALTTKVEVLQMAGKKVYSIENGALLICLDKNLTKEVITEMARKEPARVICLDSGFSGNDQLKTNAVQIMKSHKVEDFRTV